MRKHLNITIFGLVQGVFFRTTAKEQTGKLGLTGFAQNKADGSVYIEVEGKQNQLNKFIKWCHQGSSLAKVEKVTVSETPLKNFQEFNIK